MSECWIERPIKIKKIISIYKERWHPGLISREILKREARLGTGKYIGVEGRNWVESRWHIREVFEIIKVEQILNERGNLLAYHVIDRADVPHMNLVLSPNFRTVVSANSPLASKISLLINTNIKSIFIQLLGYI